MTTGKLLHLFIMSYYYVLHLGDEEEFPEFAKMVGLTATPQMLNSMMQSYIQACKHATAIYRGVHKRYLPSACTTSFHDDTMTHMSDDTVQTLAHFGGMFAQIMFCILFKPVFMPYRLI